LRHFPSTALTLLLIPGPLAFAGTTRTWAFAPFSQLKLTPAEQGAPPNGHPLRVEPAVLAQALGSIRFLAGARETALFVPEELGPMAAALAEAFALAEPGEDLELMTTRKREAGFFAGSTAVTARVFVRDGRLNVIVHDTRLDYRNEYNLENRMPTFEYGSRARQGSVVLKASQAHRADWVVLPLEGVPAAAPGPASPAPPGQAPARQAAPQVVVLPAAPAATPSTAPPASVEEKLKGLKRLREQNLITEEEYARTKQELLKDYVR